MTTESAIALIGVVMDSLVHGRHCLRGARRELPNELLTQALTVLGANGRDTKGVSRWFEEQGVQLQARGESRSARRANNQVSEEIEALIRDLLERGWNKLAVSKALRVNRRVVIRVGREMMQGGEV
jgi:hypothetical protein